MRGGYAGHGETYLTEEKILWWSHGGELHGESWKRLEFLHKIMLQTPGIGLKFAGTERDDVHGVPDVYKRQFLQCVIFLLLFRHDSKP